MVDQDCFTTTDFTFCLFVSNVLPEMEIKNLMQKSLNVSCPTNIKFCYSLFLVSQQQGRGMYKDLDSGYHYEGKVNHKK